MLTPLPDIWVTDQARAWRLAAAIWQHDGDLFDLVVSEARADGDADIVKLLAALARNLVVRVRMSIGADAMDELIGAELQACADLKDEMPKPPWFPDLGSDNPDDC